MMDREDSYSLQALDFTKSRMEKKVNEDIFPVALDLSMHPSETNCSNYVDEKQFTVHRDGRNYLTREQKLWGTENPVAEDLRVIPCTSGNRFEYEPNTPGRLKGNKTNVHNLKQDELKVNQLIGRKMKDYNELFSTKLFKSIKDVDDGSNAILSFNFPKSSASHSEDFSRNSSYSLSTAAEHKELPFVEPTDCNSRELEKNLSNSEAIVQKRETVLRYCSETSLSEVAQSSFGQSEESRELRGQQQYDVYARRFADFLKSTANNRNKEQDLLSSSEGSQGDDAYVVNILEEDSNQAEVDDSILNETDTRVFPAEEISLDQSKTCVDEEQFNEESLLESKSEITTVSEPSNAENGVQAVTGGKKRKRKGREVDNAESQSSKSKRKKSTPPQTGEANALAKSNAFEYQWPQEKNADWFVVQEHISEFLGILSFKRKYPDIFRRSVDISERNFLREHGVVTEMQCDLGLTALKTEDVCDLMSKDYPEKYQEYTKLLSSRRKVTESAKVHENTGNEKSKMENLLRKSIKSAAEYNANLMRRRYHECRAYFDLQTFEVHYPLSTKKSLPRESLKMGAYPVSLVPGQYQDYYRRYTQQELNYFPLNTALYSPHKMLKSIFTDPTCAAVDDTEDDEGPEEEHDHISISSSLDQTLDDTESITPEKDRHEDKRTGLENTDTEKQKLSASLLLDAEDSIIMEDSAENSRSSFKDSKIIKTPLSTRRIPRSSGKKKAQELIPRCVVCNQTEKNLDGEVESIVQCSDCSSSGHPSCLDLTKEMVEVIRTYSWQCMECKTCVKCMDPHDEEKMMFCDHCDRGYHTFCVGLKSIPEGRWECPSCQDVTVTPKPKRGRPFKYPRPQTASNHVTPKADAT